MRRNLISPWSECILFRKVFFSSRKDDIFRGNSERKFLLFNSWFILPLSAFMPKRNTILYLLKYTMKHILWNIKSFENDADERAIKAIFFFTRQKEIKYYFLFVSQGLVWWKAKDIHFRGVLRYVGAWKKIFHRGHKGAQWSEYLLEENPEGKSPRNVHFLILFDLLLTFS